MSISITNCLISIAVKDECSYYRLLDIIKYNYSKGSFSIWSCTCKPRCPKPTKEQMEKLNKRIIVDLGKSVKRGKLNRREKKS